MYVALRANFSRSVEALNLNPIVYGILRLSQLRGGVFIPNPRKQCQGGRPPKIVIFEYFEVVIFYNFRCIDFDSGAFLSLLRVNASKMHLKTLS